MIDTKHIIKNVFNYYHKKYTRCIFITFIFLILIIIVCLIKQQQIYFKNKSLLQTAFLGIITFSIPLLWNIHKEILDIKKQITREIITDALTKEMYEKSLKYFEARIQYITGILIFAGLILIPFSHYIIGVVIIIISFFYFLMLPQIFQKIIKNSSTVLIDFLSCKEPESEDLQNVFSKLWQKSDQDIKKEYSIDFMDLFKIMAVKINSIMNQDKDNPDLLLKYLMNFTAFINNYSIFLLVVPDVILPQILKWHLIMWEKKMSYKGNNSKLETWYKYQQVYTILSFLIRTIEERSLKEQQADLFFIHFSKHVENNKTKTVKNKENKEVYYIKSLFEAFYQVFFKEYNNSPDMYDISNRDFPSEWKVSNKNLENRENIISRITLKHFYDWAQKKIWPPNTNNIVELDEMILCLFPEIDPMTFSPILIFVLSPQKPDNQVKFIIERPWDSGVLRRPSMSRFFPSGINKDEYMKIFIQDNEQKIKREIEKTFELACFLFRDEFSEAKLKDYISQAESLPYNENSLEGQKRMRLLNIFKGMLNFIETKSTTKS